MVMRVKKKSSKSRPAKRDGGEDERLGHDGLVGRTGPYNIQCSPWKERCHNETKGTEGGHDPRNSRTLRQESQEKIAGENVRIRRPRSQMTRRFLERVEGKWT